MSAAEPWLGTEPSDVPEIDLDDSELWLPRAWHERVGADYPGLTSLIDRLCGPMYRMWEEQR